MSPVVHPWSAEPEGDPTNPSSGSKPSKATVEDEPAGDSFEAMCHDMDQEAIAIEEEKYGTEDLKHTDKILEDFEPTKTGWFNYCTVLIALYNKERWYKLESVMQQLQFKPGQANRVMLLESHIQKYGDGGPIRLGYPF